MGLTTAEGGDVDDSALDEDTKNSSGDEPQYG